MTNTSEEAWNKATVLFRDPGQNLAEQRVPQIRTTGEVQFDGAWLHLRLPNREEIVSVPASAVDWVEWSPTS